MTIAIAGRVLIKPYSGVGSSCCFQRLSLESEYSGEALIEQIRYIHSHELITVHFTVLQLKGPTYVISNGEIQGRCTAMGFPLVTIDWSTSTSGRVQMSHNSVGAFETNVTSTWHVAVLPDCNFTQLLACVAAAGTRMVERGTYLPCGEFMGQGMRVSSD